MADKNQVATVAAPTLPGLLPDIEALRLADGLYVGIDGAEVLVRRLPTQVERQMLDRRRAEIEAVMAPVAASRGEGENARALIAQLLTGYGNTRQDKSATDTRETYYQHLRKMPLFAIRRAIDDVLNFRVYDVDPKTGGRTPLSVDFAPSPIRMRAVAQKHVDALGDEQWRIERVLRARRTIAPTISEEERARVAESARKWLAGEDPRRPKGEAPTEPVDSFLERHGVDRATFDAIPDAPPPRTKTLGASLPGKI